MNANITKMQIFHDMKFDLKINIKVTFFELQLIFLLNEVRPQRSLKVTKGNFFIYRSTFSQVYF